MFRFFGIVKRIIISIITSKCIVPIVAVVGYETSNVYNKDAMNNNINRSIGVVRRIQEATWRKDATNHQNAIHQLINDGLLKPSSSSLTGSTKQQNFVPYESNDKNNNNNSNNIEWTGFDPKNPVYNFLIEYYGLKGAKGPRQLARWSPSIYNYYYTTTENENDSAIITTTMDYVATTPQYDAILLEGANENDLGTLLHLKGITSIESDGVIYNPKQYFETKAISKQKSDLDSTDSTTLIGTISSYLWYRSILQQTLTAEPILHCYGLHEWAMQYQPNGYPEPPSAKYQAHLPFRVSRDIINLTVEKNSIQCTHRDAIRYFAPAAQSLSYYGSYDTLTRDDQLRLEQPACVHAQMDLLKIILRLQPFGDCTILHNVLQLALQARKLDIGASPYSAEHYNVPVVPIETVDGRKEYKVQQYALMQQAKPIRTNLLHAIDLLLKLSFPDPIVQEAKSNFLKSINKK